MDAYNFYLTTLRYVLNAKVDDKKTWCDIFKYLPCLRQMLSCCVCGSIMVRPHGPTHGVCLHHVCRKCLGGKMRLRPSCSWCKDHFTFEENKKLRILILCFKRLCAYVRSSRLGAEISRLSSHSHDPDVENTMKALEDADQFHDDYVLTPPPSFLPTVLSSSPELKQTLKIKIPRPQFSPQEKHSEIATTLKSVNRKRGRPKNIPSRPVPPKSRVSQHVKRLKKKAINTSARQKIKYNFIQSRLISRKCADKSEKIAALNSTLLISHRPHRDRSGSRSIGQLWRETFLEETPPEIIYPDSGIEAGSVSDQDHSLQPSPAIVVKEVNPEPVRESADPPPSHAVRNRTRTVFKEPEVTISKPETSHHHFTSVVESQLKPPLTLKISKKRLTNYMQRRSSGPVHFQEDPSSSSQLSNTMVSFVKKSLSIGERKRKRSLKVKKDICKCARFKQPNRLTCFGQKCPCYSKRKSCFECLCRGCRNPLSHSDKAPSLVHMKESERKDHGVHLSMPRLSPIPRN